MNEEMKKLNEEMKRKLNEETQMKNKKKIEVKMKRISPPPKLQKKEKKNPLKKKK
jgi:hypothetical protein